MVDRTMNRPVAMILGGSSGLGAATALKLAQKGYDIILVHRDRRSDLESIQSLFENIQKQGAQCFSFNADAVNPIKQQALWMEIKSQLAGRKIKVLIHSISKGNLKPLNKGQNTLNNQDFQLTVQAMAISLFDWVKRIASDACFESDSRIIAYTSEGSLKPMTNYATVSAAKSALEAITRSIALEFAESGIKANCIQAGVTNTKSLRMIPNHKELLEHALNRNPSRRLTKPEDVANAAYLLTLPEAKWITGTVIKVDGGESLQ